MSINSLLKIFRRPPNKGNQSNITSPLFNEKTKIFRHIPENIDWLNEVLGNAPDFIIKEFAIGKHQLKAVYLEALVSNDLINDLLYGIIIDSNVLYEGKEDLFSFVKERTLNSGQVKELSNLGEVLKAVLLGETIVFFEGYQKAINITTRSFETRSIGEPRNERVIRGPKDAFNENIVTNLSLIRRRLIEPNLRVYKTSLGERTKTSVFILYIKDIADPKIFKELLRRIQSVKIDAILGSGVLEELIEDNIYSPFPQLQYSERPDKAVAQLLDGRFVMLVDNTPFALTIPAIFVNFMNSPEDYYEKWIMSSFIRIIRYIAVFLTMFLPAIYIALTTFHYNLIPGDLIKPVAEARARVPFTPFAEAIIMELTIELLREASIRLPEPIGQTIGVVGGIIIGNAAIQAGLASPLMVIVVAITAISTFILPSYNLGLAIRFVRFPIAAISAVFGGYGIILAWIILTIHLVALESFGVPYFTPLSPLNIGGLKDTLIRVPHSYMLQRPVTTARRNKKRQVPKNES
jgi:hypothetical protein